MPATDPCLKAASLDQVMSSRNSDNGSWRLAQRLAIRPDWGHQLQGKWNALCWLPFLPSEKVPRNHLLQQWVWRPQDPEDHFMWECGLEKPPQNTGRTPAATSIPGQRKMSSWLWGWFPKFLLSDKLRTSPVCQRSWWEAWLPLSMGAWIRQRETQEKCPV